MSLTVIGAGVGRTGTYSLKLALSQLGLGPCHHMDEVIKDKSRHVPMWVDAVNGKADWNAIYRGYKCAVDWPTASFFRELVAQYPSAKFILTARSPESWVESFSETIYLALAGRSQAPTEVQPWLEMVQEVVTKAGFRQGLSKMELGQAYLAHQAAIKATIPRNQLLVYQVKEGWEPLCSFLGVPVPKEPFPRTNDRAEFWERVKGKQ